MQLIAEAGPLGFSLADAGSRAGVSRALPAYHFNSRGQLLAAVAKNLVDRLPTSVDVGLPGLLQWMESELGAAIRAEPRSRALLRLIVSPDIEVVDPGRAVYWKTRVDFIERHLQTGQAVQQIRADLVPAACAPVLLGQLHGELFRIAWGPATVGPSVFLDLLRQALSPGNAATSEIRKPSAAPKSSQPGLF